MTLTQRSWGGAIGALALALVGLGAGTLAGAAASAQAPGGAAEPLHVLVGKSVLINSPARFTRVLVSNPAVIAALVTSPAQVVVEAKLAGASSLMLWDETGRSRLMDVTVDVDVAGLRQAIRAAFPRAAIQAQADGGRILLSGVAPDQAAADDLVKIAGAYSPTVVNSMSLLPVVAERQREVMLEVKFAEVDRTKVDQYGVNLFSGAGNTLASTSTQQLSPVGANPPLAGSTAPISFGINNLLNIFLYNPEINLGATIADLEQKNVLQILSSPNLMAISGQKASFLAGGEFPFPVVQGGANVGAVTIQFRPYGVELDFTGTILPDNSIRLQVAPEVSTLDYSNAVTVSGYTIPALSSRRAETTVELRDGQSFGIAGLLDQRVTVQLSRMPGIANVPILGQLFASRNNTRSNSELLVLVTPHIVDPVGGGAASAAPPAPALPYLKDEDYDRGLPGSQTKPGDQAKPPGDQTKPPGGGGGGGGGR